MKQKCGNHVTVQLLQTLNILFENIRHETSLYYLLSNNHVNSIILHKFDTTDEEVMAYYISFLKTLSFKLNPHTIHFFFNTSDFPLYTEAVKYFNHPEKMVRIAVRILTLNVFKVDEKSMIKFITGQTVPCLSDLVLFIRDNVSNIERCLKEHDKLLLKLEDLFAEHLDHLHYLNDILMLRIDDINRILSDNLMHHLIKPLVDAYKDDPHNSIIRLFTLEFTTGILSKVLATSLYEDTGDSDVVGEVDINEVSEHPQHHDHHEIKRNRLAHDVKDCDDKRDLTNDKLSSAQLANIEQSKEIAENKVRRLLRMNTRQEMTYLGIFDSEYNDMKKKQLTVDYLLMDIPGFPIGAHKKSYNHHYQNHHHLQQKQVIKTLEVSSLVEEEEGQEAYSVLGDTNLDIARHQIRSFLLWRQLLLNIRNEKDRELSLKNTSWLSYAKLLQWLE